MPFTGRYWKSGATAALVLFGLIVIRFPEMVPQLRAESILHPEADDNTSLATGRLKIWERGLSCFASRPITGIGLNNFPEAEGRHFMKQGKAAPWFTAHNTYLQVVTELGVIGFALFGTIIWHCGRRTFPMWIRSRHARAHPALHRSEPFAAPSASLMAAFFLSPGYSLLTFGAVAVLALAGRMHESALASAAPMGRTSIIPRAQGAWLVQPRT